VSRTNGGPNLMTAARAFAGAFGTLVKRPVTVTVAYDYDELLRYVNVRKVDFAWMPPLIHVRAAQMGARLVAVSQRGGLLLYRAALLVRSQSPVRKLRDLRNIRAAWVDRSSASGYLFPRLHLLADGVPEAALKSETFHGSPTAALSAVAADDADLCACFLATAHNVDDAQREVEKTFGAAAARLRVLDVTPPIPPDGMVAGGALEPDLLGKIRDALHALHRTPAGKTALRELMGADQLAQVDADVLRHIGSLHAQVQALRRTSTRRP
jgi:phosphonate transport system substrate-binding protein